MALENVQHLAVVAVSGTNYSYDRPYNYLITEDMDGTILPGMRVIVPFGGGNRKRIAIVLRVIHRDELLYGEKLTDFKPMSYAVDSEPILDAEMLEMIEWLSNNTFCTLFEAFRTLIPIGLSVHFTQKYTAVTENVPDTSVLSSSARKLWENIQRDFDLLADAKYAEVKELSEKGFLTERDEIKRRTKGASVKMLRLTEGYVTGSFVANPTLKQRKVIELLEDCGAASVREVYYICGVASGVIKRLIELGIAESFDYEPVSDPDVSPDMSVDDIVLTDEQQTCYDGLCELADARKPAGALLYGVTGSGKTSVFVKLIKHVLDSGRNVIMLIPEISLTPQVVDKFTSLFGDLVSVMHSSLSLTQRVSEYKRVKRGKARIVVGTRSAVFAPLKNIGLIVMDEEGERTYKSEAAPRYHARDVAKKRCVTHNALLLMASATPSVESYQHALNGRYKLFTMEKRYSRDRLPDVRIIDLATEGFYNTSSIFSETLVEELNINLERGEQSILLLNRRGYYTFISCCDCKAPVMCPNCSVPLTYHKVNGRLMCHYCGHSQEMVRTCPSCGSSHLKQTGVGTQKVEDEIASLFPNARVLRMDADTTYSRYAYEKGFKAFENGEYDIMLGTQMIAKGLDFPNVTLVGVVTIDKALFCGDFRSYERTFSLVTQVVGRCGRGEKQGRAFIQTYVPDHYVIGLAAEQNYKEFFSQEAAMRKALIYPPFCDTCLLEFSSEIPARADSASKHFVELMKKKIEAEDIQLPLRVLGPSRCTYEKLNGRYRYRLIIKCRNTAPFRRFIGDIYKETFTAKEFARVRTLIDINGDISI